MHYEQLRKLKFRKKKVKKNLKKTFLHHGLIVNMVLVFCSYCQEDSDFHTDFNPDHKKLFLRYNKMEMKITY